VGHQPAQVGTALGARGRRRIVLEDGAHREQHCGQCGDERSGAVLADTVRQVEAPQGVHAWS
jgi:hypothetical protein